MRAIDRHSRHHAAADPGGVARAVREAASWILVVDDELVVRDLLQRFLALEGYKVMCAADGVEGLELFHRHPGAFQAAILDVLMPRMNGADLFAAIRRIDPTLGVIVMTGFGPGEQMNEVIGQARTSSIQKPFVLGDMLLKVEALVGRDERPRSTWLTEPTSSTPRLEGITD